MSEEENKHSSGMTDDGLQESEIPAGWSKINYYLAKRSADLEAEINRLKEQEKQIIGLLKTHSGWLRTHDEWSDKLDTKLNEVYYHMFPERRDQDLKLAEQLEALTSKRNPDDEPKDS